MCLTTMRSTLLTEYMSWDLVSSLQRHRVLRYKSSSMSRRLLTLMRLSVVSQASHNS